MTTKAAAPTTPKEWEEYLNTAFATPEAFKAAYEDGSFLETLKKYQGASNKVMNDIRDQLTEQVSSAVMEMFQKNGAVPTNGKRLNLAAQRLADRNDKAPGAGLNGKFTSAVEFFQNAISNPSSFNDEQRAKLDFVRNYSSQTGEGGGFLIPEEFRAEIFNGPALESAVVRPRATVVPMGSKTLRYPAVDFSTEVGEVLGGMVFYWMDESGTVPDTSALFAQIEFNANRLAGAAIVPNDTLKDAGALDTWLRTNLPAGIRDFEDRAFLKGNGVKKPLGALHASNPALITAGDESGQSSGISWINCLTMLSRLLPESYDRAVWVVTPDALVEVFSMALPVGTGGSAVMIAPGAGNAAPQMTLLGRPLIFSRKAPATLGTAGDINLVDFSYYGIGDRQDVRVDTSEHTRFLQDDTVFKVIERVDGQPLLLSALTPENGGSTLSAFINLETRATD